MSERGSFTTNYIYSDSDYKTIRENFEKDNGKYFCCAPPASWTNGNETFYMPIVQGKVGAMTPNFEYMEVVDRLEGIKTRQEIVVAVISDCGEVLAIKKSPNGEIKIYEAQFCEGKS